MLQTTEIQGTIKHELWGKGVPIHKVLRTHDSLRIDTKMSKKSGRKVSRYEGEISQKGQPNTEDTNLKL